MNIEDLQVGMFVYDSRPERVVRGRPLYKIGQVMGLSINSSFEPIVQVYWLQHVGENPVSRPGTIHPYHLSILTGGILSAVSYQIDNKLYTYEDSGR